jgi:hypothetical protein
MEQPSMSEQKPGVPFVSEDADEQQLWSELEHLPPAAPSPQLRRRFYEDLDRASRQTRADRWRNWLGLNGTPGLVTAAGCLIAGLALGLLVNDSAPVEQAEFAELRQQVATLNRDLILDRLDNASASKRLLGVMDAVSVAEHDTEVARALLSRAVEDRVYSVRSAAIDAIGPRLSTPSVGEELMASLEKTQSPLVQLALVDLVLRHGNEQQLDRLLKLSELGRLHPDVVKHVKTSVQRNAV